MPRNAVIAQLSDIHIDGGARSLARTRAVLDHLEELPFELDAVLVTGDLADHGRPEEYERVRKALASRHPVLVLPGNHDDRAALREVLLGEPAATGPLNRVHHGEGFVLALCDSSVPGRPEGRLDEETLAWLDETVAGAPAGVPVLVAFHHPPVDLHTPAVDPIRQFGEERLAELVRRRPQIAALLCGHAHTPAATTFAGRPLLVAPGVVSTLRLPWEPPGPDAHLDLPPALAFHVLDPAGRLTTHYRVVPL